MTEPVCRRCKGNVFVFEMAPISAAEQTVDKFGRGWWDFEPGLYSYGGRWTKGRARSYVFVRIPARRIRVSFLSEFEENSPLELTILSYDEGRDDFFAAASSAFHAHKGIPKEFELAFDFTPGRLFRIEISSPTFVPDSTLHTGDTRTLGLAVFSIRLLR
jgi:hypothetical protein